MVDDAMQSDAQTLGEVLMEAQAHERKDVAAIIFTFLAVMADEQTDHE